MLSVKELIERGFGVRPARWLRHVRRHLCGQGGIRPASRFEFELEDPVLKRKISHGYDVIDAGAGIGFDIVAPGTYEP
jgi:hypothetical protein